MTFTLYCFYHTDLPRVQAIYKEKGDDGLLEELRNTVKLDEVKKRANVIDVRRVRGPYDIIVVLEVEHITHVMDVFNIIDKVPGLYSKLVIPTEDVKLNI